MFNVNVGPVDTVKLADEILDHYQYFIIDGSNAVIKEEDREGLRESFVKYTSNAIRVSRHLNRGEVKQLENFIHGSMALRCEKLKVHQFKSGGRRYVIVSAYLYAYELYPI